MKKKSDFYPDSVGYPLRMDEFSHIDKATQKKLLRLMARISESSFRRGYQHGGLESRTADPVRLRYNFSLDKSPYTNVVGESGKWFRTDHTSLHRLMVEHRGVLDALGFCVSYKKFDFCTYQFKD